MANTILIDKPQPPNTFLAGPSSGALNAVPSQRQIVAADLTAAYGLSGNTLTAFTQTATNTLAAATIGVTPTSIIGTGVGSNIIPAGALGVGKQARIMIRGRITSTAVPTFKLDLQAGGVTLCTTGTFTPAALTDTMFTLAADVSFRQAGTTATAIGEGTSIVTATLIPMVSTAASNVNVGAAVVTAAGYTVFSNPITLDVILTFSAGTTGNSLTTETVVIEIAN